MVTYEPELMFAYDSKNEYADLKNVYNVTGDDICYCPICLGRVKLWNGQDPNRTYLKQRCFHHIDGMCSQESRIHFAHKTWLLEKNSKFKVGDDLYEVKSVKLEQTLKTAYGNYRPDIIVETVNDKTFYIEIADTNKKTDEYVLKWDELGNDVIEIDVNEQLSFITAKDIPVFNLIYSSDIGQCLIKRYIRQDYDEIFTERKLYWKRKDLLNYKIKWERLDWFWLILQEYYAGRKTVEDVYNSFESIEFEDQKFICSRFKSRKHKQIKYELESHYSDLKELEKVHLQHISNVIRELNKEFGFSTTSSMPYLHRNGNYVIFEKSYGHSYSLRLKEDMDETYVYNYFHDYMKDYYEERTERILKRQREEAERKEKIKQQELQNESKMNEFRNKYEFFLKDLYDKINNCTNGLWEMSYTVCKSLLYQKPACEIKLKLAKYWSGEITFVLDGIDFYTQKFEFETTEDYMMFTIKYEMNHMWNEALVGKSLYRRGEVRLLEVK